MLASREVQHIAKLARIDLTEEEIMRFQKDLGSILEYVDILREVDISSLPVQGHAPLLQNVTRQDAAKAEDSQKRQRLFAMAPTIQDGYLKVKSIL